VSKRAKLSLLPHAEFVSVVALRRDNRMRRVDAMSEEWREVVHDFGLCVVDALQECGVTQARHGRHIIRTVLAELGPLNGGSSNQGVRMAGNNRQVMVPLEPTEGMVEAAMATVSTFDAKITKREKHRLRLRAALAAAAGARKGF
jgi:hypothetical protein